MVLVARNAERLQRVSDDLTTRGASVEASIVLDVADLTMHQETMTRAENTLGQIDVALVAHGTLTDQARAERDVGTMIGDFTTNATATMSLLTIIANRMESKASGCLAVISSVAGDRGRQSNYVYGASKAALDAFLSGLRNRLQQSGVAVVTIKPGFVDTPMTSRMKHNALFVSPARAARAVYAAIAKRRNVVYVPWFWRWIMLLIRLIPEPLFKRLRL
jgi:short-subunit dehydrogenase